MTPRLSICIATLNRAAFIGETLESIVTQLSDEVEVVIVDGASTDNTAAVVARFQARHGAVRYVRLEKNGGVDQDYSRAVSEAVGDYVWLMTDDDIVQPGAIAAVLRTIAKGYSLVVLNSELRTSDLRTIVAPNRVSFDADRYYPPGHDSEVLRDLGDYLSFIGGVVIDRELWNARDKESYFGTLFIHFGVIFQAALPRGCYFLARPWIIIRYGNAMWTPKAFDIWMFKWPRLVWSFAQFAEEVRRAVVHPQPWRRPRTLLMYRAIGGYSIQQYHQLEAVAGRANFPAKAIALVPARLANMVVAAACATVYRQSAMLKFSLRDSQYYWRSRFSHAAG